MTAWRRMASGGGGAPTMLRCSYHERIVANCVRTRIAGVAKRRFAAQGVRAVMTQSRRKTFLSDLIRKYTPTREQLARNRYLAPFAHRFLLPELWRFTRRSVPRGVALGIFAGFIVPLGQVFLAAFMALPARANVPLAVLVTFITNPFTLPFWAVGANRVGDFILRLDRAGTGGAASEEMSSGRYSWFLELFEGVGVTVLETVFGFVVLAVVGAALGYVLSSFVWRYMVGRKRRKRLRRMTARLDRRLEAGDR